jgi:hypothetical protein
MLGGLDENTAKSIRASIVSGCKRLDTYLSDLEFKVEKKRRANARHVNGFAGRLADARHKAEASYPEAVRTDLLDDIETRRLVVGSIQRAADYEDPSRGIHRAIIHKVYADACTLYQRSYPRFYPGNQGPLSHQREEVFPVPLTGPDYLTLAVNQSAEDLQASSGVQPCYVRTQRPDCVGILRLYFSKSFPISFSEFCHRVADKLEELEEDQTEALG